MWDRENKVALPTTTSRESAIASKRDKTLTKKERSVTNAKFFSLPIQPAWGQKCPGLSDVTFSEDEIPHDKVHVRQRRFKQKLLLEIENADII
jgi:hypothetical protein